MNVMKFLGFKSDNEKIKSYRNLLTSRRELLREGISLAKSFDENNSLLKSIEIAEDKVRAMERYNERQVEHNKKVVATANKISSIEKSMSKLEADGSVGDIAKSIKQIENISELYKSGKVKEKVLNDLYKAIQGKVLFSDIIVDCYDENFGRRFLVMQRTSNGESTPYWCIPGGHIEIGESPIEAARRELFEGTGINAELYPDLTKDNPITLKEVGKVEKEDLEITYFMCTLPDRWSNTIVVDAMEGSSLNWVTWEELKNLPFYKEDQKKNIQKILFPWEVVDTIVKLAGEKTISKSVFDQFIQDNQELVEKANEHYFSEKERENLADEDKALPDGSFPIRNEQDLKDAIRSYGRAKNKERAKKWIVKRAKKLGKENILPKDWVEKDISTQSVRCLERESLEEETEKLTKAMETLIEEKVISPSEENRPFEILDILSRAFCEEMLAWYQYWLPAKFLVGRERKSVESTFLDHATDESLDHGTKLLQRISELGGDVEGINSPDKWFELSECEYFPPEGEYDVEKLVQQNIYGEECAIQRYTELAALSQHTDPTTYHMALEILADEEEHLRSLKDFIADFGTDERDIHKSKTGTYVDNAENRSLHRVGQRYGTKKGEGEEVEIQETKTESKEGDNKSPESYAKETSTGKLQEFVEKDGVDEKLKEVAQKEIESRRGEGSSTNPSNEEANWSEDTTSHLEETISTKDQPPMIKEYAEKIERMNNLSQQYQAELKEAKQQQKQMIANGKHGEALRLLNYKIQLLIRFVNDSKNVTINSSNRELEN